MSERAVKVAVHGPRYDGLPAPLVSVVVRDARRTAAGGAGAGRLGGGDGGDIQGSRPSSAYAELSAGTRYRVKVIGDAPDGTVTCAFEGPGGFRHRFSAGAAGPAVATWVPVLVLRRRARRPRACRS